MPYGKFRRRFRRRRSARKPLKRLAKRTYRRRSARAQSRQIRTVARHLSKLKHTVNKELTLPCTYQCSFSGQLANKNMYLNDIIVPLTCGPNPSAQHGDTPVTTLRAVPQTLQWLPCFQGANVHPGALPDNTTPQWLKFYKQTFKLKFYAGTIQSPNVVTVSVIRVNPKLISQVKSVAMRCDGPEFIGPEPDLQTQVDYISPGMDYVKNDGLIFNQPSAGGTPPQPSNYAAGSQNIFWNKNLWTVDYQKQFTLGAARNPLIPNTNDMEGRPPYNPSQFMPDDNQHSEECRFTINYGGMKISTVPSDDIIAFNRMDCTQAKYSEIPPEHKRWLIINQSNPPNVPTDENEDPVYSSFVQMNSILSARAPA